MDGLRPERGFRVTLMLADYAHVAEGKLNVMGGSWTVTGPEPVPFAIAGSIGVPWELTNKRHTLRFELVDLDGNGVIPIGGDEPLSFELGFEVGRPPGVRAGTTMMYPFAINCGPLPLAAGGHYEWRLSIDGEMKEDWRLGFATRPDDQAQAA